MGTFRNSWQSRGSSQATLTGSAGKGILIDGDLKKKFIVQSIIPKNMEKFPWSGHLGGRLVEDVWLGQLNRQALPWFSPMLDPRLNIGLMPSSEIRPKWEDELGIHHGSLDRKSRASSGDEASTWRNQSRSLYQQFGFGRRLFSRGASHTNRRTQRNRPSLAKSWQVRSSAGSG